MPNILVAASGTQVARGGASLAWSITSPSASATGFVPGEGTEYLRFQLLPGVALTALPAFLAVTITEDGTYPADSEIIESDTVRLGTSGAPTGGNSLNIGSVPGSSTAKIYLVATSGFSLADVNAGNVYLWLGYRSVDTVQVKVDLSVTNTGVTTVNGAPAPYSVGPDSFTNQVPGDATFSLLPTALGVTQAGATITTDCGISNSNKAFVYMEIQCYGTASGTAIGSAQSVVTGSNAPQGGTVTGSPFTDSFTVSTSPDSITVKVLTPGGIGACPQSTGSIDNTPSVGVYASVEANEQIVYTVMNPPASSLAITVDSVDTGVGGFGGGFDGTFDGFLLGNIRGSVTIEEEMTCYIDDVLPVFAQTTQYSTGEASDTDGAVPPTYRVYEQITGTPILTGSLALVDDANTVGFYGALLTLSAANGFEENKFYTVRSAAAVDSINQAGIIAYFSVRAATLASIEGTVDLLRKYQTNLYVQNGAVISLYDDGDLISDLPLLTQTVSDTLTGMVRTEAT